MNDFTEIVRQTRSRHRVRVRKWRANMSGSAWQVRYDDGRVVRWIEAPFPKTDLSLSIFLHEVGHHVIGFDRYKHRCEEEYHVWLWALDEMRRLQVEPGEKVMNRFRLSMEYAVGKALAARIKQLAEPLQEFQPQAA